jgi:hypothetical protein
MNRQSVGRIVLRVLAVGLLSAAELVGISVFKVWAAEPALVSSNIAVDIAELKDQLNSGLKARRPEEFAFIARVVEMVDDGQLPIELVQSTFQWARFKKPYPYPYFDAGLRARAAKLGINIE